MTHKIDISFSHLFLFCFFVFLLLCSFFYSNPTAVGQHAAQSLPVLVKMVNEEQHSKTRETAAWTLSRVTEYQYEAIPPASIEHIVRAALTGLKAPQGGVCAQCCTVLHRIAANQGVDGGDENEPTNLLSRSVVFFFFSFFSSIFFFILFFYSNTMLTL